MERCDILDSIPKQPQSAPLRASYWSIVLVGAVGRGVPFQAAMPGVGADHTCLILLVTVVLLNAEQEEWRIGGLQVNHLFITKPPWPFGWFRRTGPRGLNRQWNLQAHKGRFYSRSKEVAQWVGMNKRKQKASGAEPPKKRKFLKKWVPHPTQAVWIL